MSQADLLRVSATGSSQTFSVTPDDLNHSETARQIAWQLTEIMGSFPASTDAERRLNLDLRDVGWMGSAALNELIRIKSTARNHGIRLVLTNVVPPVRDVFTLTRLERMFEFEDDLDE